MMKVFISHAGEDTDLAEQLGRDLRGAGIDTFLDRWDIKPGDALRDRIDRGLTESTHFLVLLTPTSVEKAWVKAEMDAAFVLRVDEEVPFVPVRHGLAAQELPPLLRALYSPSLDDYDAGLRVLIGYLTDVVEAPPLGVRLAVAKSPLPQEVGLSTGAAKIVEYMVMNSEYGRWNDPHPSPSELMGHTGLIQSELVLVLDELESEGLVDLQRAMSPPIGILEVRPTYELFVSFDGSFFPWVPETDAREFVASLLNSEVQSTRVEAHAKDLGWSIRRANPAVAFLLHHGFVMASEEVSFPWIRSWVKLEPAAIRWVRAGKTQA